MTAGLGTSLGAVLWASRGRHGGWSRVRVLLEEERSDVTVGNGARCANPGGGRDRERASGVIFRMSAFSGPAVGIMFCMQLTCALLET